MASIGGVARKKEPTPRRSSSRGRAVVISNFCLKDSRDGVDLISSGSLFHSRIVDGRNESQYDRDEAWICRKLQGRRRLLESGTAIERSPSAEGTSGGRAQEKVRPPR